MTEHDAASNIGDLFEIIRTTRLMRRLKRVPNELIRKILEAGVCAPSGGNVQRWRFLMTRARRSRRLSGPTTSAHGRAGSAAASG
jgi:nitroreductase